MFSYFGGGISSIITVNKIEEYLNKLDLKDMYKTYHLGDVCAISFTIEYNGIPLQVSLPINVYAVQEKLKCKHKRAHRVACELLSDWVIRTVRMIQAGQINIVEGFLPYIFDKKTGKTFFESIVKQHIKIEEEK